MARFHEMVHLCNQAKEAYNDTKNAHDARIEKAEQRLQMLANKPENAEMTATLLANKRLTRSETSGTIYVRLDT